MNKYILLDTFYISYLNQEQLEKVSLHIKKLNLIIIISSYQLVEIFNPNPTGDERINKYSKLLSMNPFVIADQKDLYNKEYSTYPNYLSDIPIRLFSDDILRNTGIKIKKDFIYSLLKGDIHTVPLRTWVEEANEIKNNWQNSVANIINGISEIGNDKKEILQYLDFRMCDEIRYIHECLSMNNLDKIKGHNRLKKVYRMSINYDTYILKSIHFLFLLFYYDYIVSKKQIKSSDIGDYFIMSFLPYCYNMVIDNSKFDTCDKITKNENNVNIKEKYYNKKMFDKLIIK
jgi:hypothetical protein